MSAWWEEQPELTAHARELMADVDAAFETTGADTPGWDDPHAEREPEPDEYSRVTNPGKYRILNARLEAWIQVVTSRGWATLDDDALVPSNISAWPLRWKRGYDGVAHYFYLGNREIHDVIGCGSDACDDGSAPFLRDLDAIVLCAVDGSWDVYTRGVESPLDSWGRVPDYATPVAQPAAWGPGWDPMRGN